ncbi:MAG: response regulator transcription factor [Synergistaceae bacterium]|nr:response regulator transcription factor [Synergistaceae bacterium]
MLQGTGYNIAVVDDKLTDGVSLQRGIQGWFDENFPARRNVTRFPDGASLLRVFEPEMFHIIFMDIIMDSMSGIDTARTLRDSDRKALLVFTTTSDEFVFEAFPLHPFDYVMKPCTPEKLGHVLSEAVKVIDVPEECLTVRVSRSVYKIPLRKISAVLSNNHFVEIVMSDGNCLLCSMTFCEVEAELMGDRRFLTCNRGLIINMDRVSSLSRDKSSVIMSDGKQYALKVRGRAEVLRVFTQYQISRIRREARA